MRKRLRKKLHKGEFQEMGFEVQFRMTPVLTDQDFDAFIDLFIEEAIEANGLSFGGGGSRDDWSGFVALDGRGSITDEHRDKVEQWFENQPQILLDWHVGPFVDAWYPD
ncbi:MAG: YggL family protein [bacterium]|nr:YggL family protein [bacterium]